MSRSTSASVRPARSAIDRVISVTVKPGATTLAVMPYGPSSSAIVLVKPIRPALAAA